MSTCSYALSIPLASVVSMAGSESAGSDSDAVDVPIVVSVAVAVAVPNVVSPAVAFRIISLSLFVFVPYSVSLPVQKCLNIVIGASKIPLNTCITNIA